MRPEIRAILLQNGSSLARMRLCIKIVFNDTFKYLTYSKNYISAEK